MQGRSRRPNKLSTTLAPTQEVLVVELRRTLLLALDDLLAITNEFINPEVSRSGLDRCLRRHGVSKLASLVPVVEGETPPKKTFKDDESGFIPADIKHLPQIPDEAHRRYLFVAIDRATRWVYLRTYPNQSELSSTDFVRRIKRAAPMVINKLLTDNGSQFTSRFTSADKQARGNHAFDIVCTELGIEHRLAPARRPQTNGMAERINARISNLIAQTRFSCAAELELNVHAISLNLQSQHPTTALHHQTSIQAPKS